MQQPQRSASPFLWALVVVSLLLNVLVIATLAMVAVMGRQVAADMADQLDAFGQQTVNYKFHISQEVPVKTSIPFNHSTVVHYSQVMPISTTVKVAKEIPVVGQIAFDVPIQANIPISLSIPVQISRTIDVDAEVPLSLDIPLEIPLKDTPLRATLDSLVKTLNAIAGR